MLSGKLALSFHEEKKLCSYDTPSNSPKQFMGVPNNTPQHSPMESTSGSCETLGYQSRFSPCLNSTFTLNDFQNQLLQNLLIKFPQANNSKEDSWVTTPNALPVITLSPVKATMISYDTSCIGTRQNMTDHNSLPLSRSFSELNLVQSSPISDKMSTFATCASGGSYVDLSDFENSFTNEELPPRELSLSLSDLQNFDKGTDFGNDKLGFKLLKKTTSFDELQDIVFKFDL